MKVFRIVFLLVCLGLVAMTSSPMLAISGLTIAGGDTSCTLTSCLLSITGGTPTCGATKYLVYWQAYNTYTGVWDNVASGEAL